MKLIDLFEPKLPPINLLCVSPAIWFYRSSTSMEIAKITNRSVKSVDSQRIRERLMSQHNGRDTW